MKLLSYTILGLVLTALITISAINNLWRFLPEFNQLTTIFHIPLYIQVTSFIVALVSTFFLLKKWILWASIPITILSIILTILSSYHLTISNSVNSFSLTLYPFYEKEFSFEAIKTIKFEQSKLLITTDSESYPIYTGIPPFTINQKAIWNALSSYGDCTNQLDNHCIQINFLWP